MGDNFKFPVGGSCGSTRRYKNAYVVATIGADTTGKLGCKTDRLDAAEHQRFAVMDVLVTS